MRVSTHTHTYTLLGLLDQYLRAASLDPGPPAYFTFPFPCVSPTPSLLVRAVALLLDLLSSAPHTHI